MQAEENKAAIRRLALIINSGNLEKLNEVLAPSYIRHDPNPLLKDVGWEAYQQAFKRLRNAFPDAVWTLEEVFCDGNRVIGGRFTGPKMDRSLIYHRVEKKSGTLILQFIALKTG